MKTVKVGDQTCKFDPSNHTYTVDGETIPGTTTITGMIDKSDQLKWWAVNCSRDYILDEMEPGREYDETEIKDLAQGARMAHRKSSSDATTIGTVVHSFAENWINAQLDGSEGPDLPVNDEARESAQQFLAWVEDNDVEFLATEQMVYHPRYNYAGTYDCKARVNGDLLILDFKTSKSIYDEYHLQATAYYMAECERVDEDLDGYGIIRFPKSGADFEVVTETDLDQIVQHWQGFFGCLTIYEWQQEV